MIECHDFFGAYFLSSSSSPVLSWFVAVVVNSDYILNEFPICSRSTDWLTIPKYTTYTFAIRTED